MDNDSRPDRNHSPDDRPRFVEVTAEDGTTVIYHREDRSQWIQSDVAVDRLSVR